MQNVPISQLAFKGTHNSYQCVGGTIPVMNHPVNAQIDDFGVWGVELDVGVELNPDTQQLEAVVGHNGPGDGICEGWGYRLSDFLEVIAGTEALKYRPVFIYLEIKDSFGALFPDWSSYDSNTNTGRCRDHLFKYGVAREAVAQVFGENFIELFAFVDRNGGFPTVPQMAGKAIVYYPKPEYTRANPDLVCGFIEEPFKGTLEGHVFDACTLREEIQPQPPQVFRVDQYQADWTFDYGVPPNPLVVDSATRPPLPVPAAVGRFWTCVVNGDVSHGEIVAEQGTFRFPFKTVGRAVNRAEGTTPLGPRDQMRAGFGWTMLIRPGTYLESVRIDIPLTLKKTTALARW